MPSVDDDPDVLRAITRELRSQYGAEYRVMSSDPPEAALNILKELKVHNDGVAHPRLPLSLGRGRRHT